MKEIMTVRRVAVGVDLGQSADPTSIAAVEHLRPEIAPDMMAWLRTMSHDRRRDRIAELRGAFPPERYNLRLLEQAPLGESYPAQAGRVNQILSREEIARHAPKVWIDYTGVGRAVFDIFKAAKVPGVVPVTITFAGNAGPNGRGGHSVPKIDLVSRLQAAMHMGKLHMPDTLPLAKVFRRELMDFRVSYSDVGNARFGAREGAHDDLILAVALAVYGLSQERPVKIDIPFACQGRAGW